MPLSLGNATSTTIFSSKTDNAVGFEVTLICPASQKSISLSDTFCSAFNIHIGFCISLLSASSDNPRQTATDVRASKSNE